jgi:hypothetical protein
VDHVGASAVAATQRSDDYARASAGEDLGTALAPTGGRDEAIRREWLCETFAGVDPSPADLGCRLHGVTGTEQRKSFLAVTAP